MKEWIRRQDGDLWTSLFLIILSGAVMYGALELEVGTPINPGSGFLILGASGVLGLLALHQFITSIASAKRHGQSTRGTIHWGQIVSVILATILYILSLQPVGYLVCTFLLLGFLFHVLERGHWAARTLGAAATSLVTYVLFAKVLQLNLPKGLMVFF